MTRPLRVGDRVAATGTVTKVIVGGWNIQWDGSAHDTQVEPWDLGSLTIIAPAELPVGSVVVKDGKAFVRWRKSWHTAADGAPVYIWDDISDGDVIFTPGGDADVG